MVSHKKKGKKKTVHGLIFGRAYCRKDICAWDLVGLFSGGLIFGGILSEFYGIIHGRGGGGGELNKTLYEKTSPRDPNPHPQFYIPFWIEKVPLAYTFHRKLYPFWLSYTYGATFTKISFEMNQPFCGSGGSSKSTKTHKESTCF